MTERRRSEQNVPAKRQQEEAWSSDKRKPKTEQEKSNDASDMTVSKRKASGEQLPQGDKIVVVDDQKDQKLATKQPGVTENNDIVSKEQKDREAVAVTKEEVTVAKEVAVSEEAVETAEVSEVAPEAAPEQKKDDDDVTPTMESKDQEAGTQPHVNSIDVSEQQDHQKAATKPSVNTSDASPRGEQGNKSTTAKLSVSSRDTTPPGEQDDDKSGKPVVEIDDVIVFDGDAYEKTRTEPHVENKVKTPEQKEQSTEEEFVVSLGEEEEQEFALLLIRYFGTSKPERTTRTGNTHANKQQSSKSEKRSKGKEQENEVPHPWSKIISSKGQTYYYNKETGESVWEIPKPRNDTDKASAAKSNHSSNNNYTTTTTTTNTGVTGQKRSRIESIEATRESNKRQRQTDMFQPPPLRDIEPSRSSSPPPPTHGHHIPYSSNTLQQHLPPPQPRRIQAGDLYRQEPSRRMMQDGSFGYPRRSNVTDARSDSMMRARRYVYHDKSGRNYP